MNLNLSYKSVTFILATILIILAFLQFKGCEDKNEIVNQTYNTELQQSTIDDANNVIDSLMNEITIIRKKKQAIVTRIETRKVYIDARRDTIRKLIKDSSVLAYVDTLETQIADNDSVIKSQVKEILSLDMVIYKKDIVILNKDIIQAKTEEELNASQADSKKKDKRIKLLKIERVLYPAIAIIGGIYLSLKL